MRLINTATSALEEFTGHNIPKYAILSHTWEEEEVTYQDYVSGAYTHMKGHDKVRMVCLLAAREGIGYAWIDTCCIDKRSSAELTESINSMYQWYQRSVFCYAFLSDLPLIGDLDDTLRGCRWFTRGWTLQELIAPRNVIFFDSTWSERGTKISLAELISDITQIDSLLLLGKASLSEFSVAQKMSWAARRETTRIEDLAYCLLGIFDLNLPLLYGEEEKAFRRLQEEIIRTTPDLSILAWKLAPPGHATFSYENFTSDVDYDYIFSPHEEIICGVLARSPAEFYDCAHYVSHVDDAVNELSISSIGIKTMLRILLSPNDGGDRLRYILPLNCGFGDEYLGIGLRQVGPEMYLREEPRMLVGYKSSSAFLGVQSNSIRPMDRYLLVKHPKHSGYQDFRFGHASKILRQVRSHMLRIIGPRQFMFIEPWPLSNYDHVEQSFCVPHPSRQDLSLLKILAQVNIPSLNGRSESLVFGAWILAIDWSKEDPNRAQFAIIEDDARHQNKKSLDEIISLVSGSDYHGGQVKTLLDTYGIAPSSVALCAIIGTPFKALVTLEPHFENNRNVSTRGSWKVILKYTIHETNDVQIL